jgi:hypothetical protein
MNLIVWDVDDVLNDLMRAWFEQHWLPRHPECPLRYEQLRENPPHRLLGIAEADYLASLDEFRQSDAARALAPNLEILAWLRTRGAHFRHMALTSRPIETTPPVAEWVFQHFGDYLRTFSVVPTRQPSDLPVYERSKGKFLRWLGKEGVLVDDNETHVEAATAGGMSGVVFPRPWNRSRLTVAETLELIQSFARRQRRVRHRPEPMECYDEAV